MAITAAVTMDGVDGRLIDISVGGVAVAFPAGTAPSTGQVELQLPEAEPVTMSVVRIAQDSSGQDVVSCRLLADDWEGYRAMSLWLFHTPAASSGACPSAYPRSPPSVWERNPRAVSSFGKPLPAPSTA